MTYGVHAILACLLLILCFAPIGRALSLDRVREVRSAKRKNLAAASAGLHQSLGVRLHAADADPDGGDVLLQRRPTSCEATTGGTAMPCGRSSRIDDYYNGMLLDLLASHYWLVNVATYGTVLIEIAYPFLIWQRRSRPYLLAAAIFLHLQFALLMNLYFFSFVMIMGHMSFLRPQWLRELGALVEAKNRRHGDDLRRHCGFCKRSMAWFLAFDGLRQIRSATSAPIPRRS